jgi:ATP-dependent helicase/nuclease subunit B
MLAEWAGRAEQRGELDEAEEHRQVWRDVTSFLDDMGFALADEPLSIDELAEVLEAGLAQLSLGLTPPMLDQVLVGSIDRSRHPELRAVILIGFNDGVFPKPAMEDAILGDDDREALLAAGVPVLAPARTRTLEEDLLVYIGVTRASRRLTVTYATADEAGKTLRPSPCVAALLRACPGLRVETVGDPALSRADWDILAACDLSRRIALEFRTRPAIEADDADRRAVFNELYERVRCGADAAPLARAMRAFRDPTPIRLSKKLLDKALPRPMRTSVSRLETYASCPFKYFAESMLGLAPRAEAALEAADVGTVHHAILEDFVEGLARRGTGFGQLDEGEVVAGLEASCGRVGAKRAEGGVVSLSRDAYVLSRTRDALRRVLLAQRSLGVTARTRPRGTEVPFGFDAPGSLPALEIRTPKGRRVIVRGYIDRVDVAELSDELLGVVVDYKKTPDKRLDLSGAYHGTSLQLIGYLLALSDHGESLAGRPVRPIGAFYVSLTPKYKSVDHPDDVIDDNATETPHAPRGILSAGDLDVLQADHPDTGWSGRYSVYLKKDGTLGHLDKSDAASNTQFQSILDHTRRKIGELADDIHDGDVSVRPVRLGTWSPCSWCHMRGVCRFEIGRNEVRYLDRMKRSTVFEAVSGD